MPSILSRDQVNSTVWSLLKAHAEKRIADIRAANDSLRASETDTAANRGAIKELKRLIKSVEPREIQTNQQKRRI